MFPRGEERRDGWCGVPTLRKPLLLLGMAVMIMATLSVHASPVDIDQTPLGTQSLRSHLSPVLPPGSGGRGGRVRRGQRKLYGRFLHITGKCLPNDIHNIARCLTIFYRLAP